MKDSSGLTSGIMGNMYGLTYNKSLKPTATRVTPFAEPSEASS